MGVTDPHLPGRELYKRPFSSDVFATPEVAHTTLSVCFAEGISQLCFIFEYTGVLNQQGFERWIYFISIGSLQVEFFSNAWGS